LGDDFRRVYAEYIGPHVPLKYKNASYLTRYNRLSLARSGMDLSRLKSEFGNKLILNGGIDSKNILIDGASHDTILEETPVENVLAMFDTIMKYQIT